jgi:hypothetical protein
VPPAERRTRARSHDGTPPPIAAPPPALRCAMDLWTAAPDCADESGGCPQLHRAWPPFSGLPDPAPPHERLFFVGSGWGSGVPGGQARWASVQAPPDQAAGLQALVHLSTAQARSARGGDLPAKRRPLHFSLDVPAHLLARPSTPRRDHRLQARSRARQRARSPANLARDLRRRDRLARASPGSPKTPW